MKICIYSPYFPNHFGGGEKYLLDLAFFYAKDHDVDIALSNHFNLLSSSHIRSIKKKYESFFGQSLSKINFVSTPIGGNSFFLNKLAWTKKYDVLYYQTDGSLFFSLAKKNILHIQVPLKLDKSSFIEKIKLSNWQIKNTNSSFTKKVIENSWKTRVDLVHHPMIEDSVFLTNNSELDQKQKTILNVGRFFRHQHSKKQEVLIDVFSEMISRHPSIIKGWKLILVGGVEDKKYASEIAEKSQNLPIEIIHKIDRSELLSMFKKSSIYWHATGFGIDENNYPEKMEHFGITTVEAMASGCVPIVINKGGQKEILGSPLKELLWDTKEECLAKTIKMINNDQERRQMQLSSIKQAQKFNSSHFYSKAKLMLEM